MRSLDWLRRTQCVRATGLILSALAIGDARGQEASAAYIANAAVNRAVASELAIVPAYRLEPAGPKPESIALDCGRLHNLAKAKAFLVIETDDMKVVEKILKATTPNHGHILFTNAPQHVMWWVRKMGSISILSLGTAVHEANHAVDAALTRCNDGAATYSLHGKTIITQHKFGDSPNYSILAVALPSSLKSHQVGSRYPQYVEQNGLHSRSDFSILMDELIAYIGAAELEISIAKSSNYSWLVNPEFTGLNVNVGGVADFMIYTLSYLKSVRNRYPAAYSKVRQQPTTIDLLQRVWTAAESVLVSAYDVTKNANKGGILIVPKEAIAIAYSDEFISELDRLGISHASANSWATTYLKEIK
jgi:hypothetical protein